DIRRVAEQRQAHEGGNVAKARHHRAGDRLRKGRLGGVRSVVHAAYLGIHCVRKRAFRAVTNSSTAATNRSPSPSPIMMLSATKPRRAIQMPAAIMSKKNSSLASWLLLAISAAVLIGRPVA